MMQSHSNLLQLARAMGGLPVYGCLPGSPAEARGVRYGDILLSVDGVATPTWDAFIEARARSGASILVKLFRDGVEFEIEIPLDRNPVHDPLAVASFLGIVGNPESSN